MAFLGKIGKTLGLGSTEQVAVSTGLAYATGNPAFLTGAFNQEQGGSAQETFTGPNLQGGIETQQAGSQLPRQSFMQARTGSRGIVSQIPTSIPEAVGMGIDYFLGMGGNDVCQPQGQKPFSVNKMNGCITVTRKQQSRLKEMVSIVGLEMTADAVGLDPDQLVLLLLKRFKARGRGITAASMKTTKRTIRQIKSLHSEVSSMAGRKTPVRRTAAVKQVKYSN